MANLQPFRALHYNPSQVELSKALAPPYDVISPEEREKLQANPHNIIHLILGQNHIGSGVQADAAYVGAGEYWRNWRDEGVLVQDAAPAFYLYEQQFHNEGDTFTRTGLAAAVRLEAYENRVIFPHEKTFPGPKQDRLKLMESVNANLDSVFGLYDAEQVDLGNILADVKRTSPLLSGSSPDGQKHRVWAIADSGIVAAIRAAFESAPLVIADGHHRYETALNYRDQQKAKGNSSPALDYVMMTLCAIQDPGLLVLPTHRLIHGAEGESPVAPPGPGLGQVLSISYSNAFRMESTGSGNHTLDRLSKAGREGRFAYGVYCGEEAGFVLTPKEPAAHAYEEITRFSEQIVKRLPEILEVKEIKVDYSHSGAEAICQVNAGNAWLAILLQGLPLREVYDAALNGALMPEKSTYFYPKLQSGLLMRSLD